MEQEKDLQVPLIIMVEMVDLELGTIVWSGAYEMRKAAQDNVLYR